MMGITYDTGALVAAEANRVDIWALHRDALRHEIRPVVPAAVLAQAWRGGPQHQLSRLLRGCKIEPMTEQLAREAGAACAAARTSDVVDATVVISALSRGDLVVTSDLGDLARLSDALNVSLRLHGI
ncbi:twitching motility protein PilT [Jiangella rhizosphaerae]|uniref:Twitching motility protein PilT n=2 Tax=Jiangella rhizosphaerae TaxID=2293569 RepID=A0A418KQ07_9ACTN|nr:twitching motility protein PilT [Jiangella rhizosphaerae]